MRRSENADQVARELLSKAIQVLSSTTDKLKTLPTRQMVSVLLPHPPSSFQTGHGLRLMGHDTQRGRPAKDCVTEQLTWRAGANTYNYS